MGASVYVIDMKVERDSRLTWYSEEVVRVSSVCTVIYRLNKITCIWGQGRVMTRYDACTTSSAWYCWESECNVGVAMM